MAVTMKEMLTADELIFLEKYRRLSEYEKRVIYEDMTKAEAEQARAEKRNNFKTYPGGRQQ